MSDEEIYIEEASKKDNISELEVLFNSACPVCKAGIEFQKNAMPYSNVVWTDVHLKQEALNGLKIENVRKYLHVREHGGHIYIGIYAFIKLWKRSPNQRFIAILFSMPGINFIAKHAYNGFAELLYRWNRFNKHW